MLVEPAAWLTRFNGARISVPVYSQRWIAEPRSATPHGEAMDQTRAPGRYFGDIALMSDYNLSNSVAVARGQSR